MRRIVLLWVAAALCGCPPPPHGEPCASKTGSAVTVRGSSSLRVKPDTVSFTVGVETQGASVREIFDENAKRVDAMITALKERGVTPEQIQTSNLDVGTLMDDQNRPIGFRVSNLLTVSRPDPASAAELLQHALEAGANNVGGLQFGVAEPGAFERQGVERAFQDARAKADSLAGLAGKRLGDVVCVSDESGSAGPRPMMARAVGYAEASIEPGAQELQFHVSATFELQPR